MKTGTVIAMDQTGKQSPILCVDLNTLDITRSENRVTHDGDPVHHTGGITNSRCPDSHTDSQLY